MFLLISDSADELDDILNTKRKKLPPSRYIVPPVDTTELESDEEQVTESREEAQRKVFFNISNSNRNFFII